MSESTKRRYQGSCACGKVKFEADIDFAQGTHKCNCTQCWKRRWWSVKVQPGDFRLLSGDEVVDRDFEVCPGCQVITHRHVPAAQWNPQDYVSVNVATLDDLPPAVLLESPVTYYDGRADNWWQRPAEVRHL